MIFESVAGLFEFCDQGFFRRKRQSVFGGGDFVVEAGQSIAGGGVIFLGAEDEADGRVFARARPVFAGVVQIQMHLAGVGVGDRTLKNLNTDLIGKLYKVFDPQSLSESIAPQLQRSLKDKSIIS